MKKSGKFYLLNGAGLLAAGLVWAQSTVIVDQRRAPERAVTIGVPPQGWAKASLSRAMQVARLVKDPKSNPEAPERRLAEEAFAAEPLATSALPVLIQSIAADGNLRDSERLLVLAGELTRRDNLINAMLIDEATKRHRPEQVVQLLGRAMSVDYEARYFYVDRLAAATARPGAIEVLAPMLGQNPRWSIDYWRTIIRIPEVLQQAGKIRLRISGPPWNRKRPTDTDFDLVAELVRRDYIDLANQVARALGMSAPQEGELLMGSRFDRKSRFAPFEWELLQTGDIGTTIEPEDHRLSISSLASSSGIAARQLSFVPAAGSYRLRWRLSGLGGNPDAALKFRLTCAEPKKIQPFIAPILLKDGSASAPVSIAGSACNWYWVTLELDAAGSTVGTDIVIRELSLRREGKDTSVNPGI